MRLLLLRQRPCSVGSYLTIDKKGVPPKGGTP